MSEDHAINELYDRVGSMETSLAGHKILLRGHGDQLSEMNKTLKEISTHMGSVGKTDLKSILIVLVAVATIVAALGAMWVKPLYVQDKQFITHLAGKGHLESMVKFSSFEKDLDDQKEHIEELRVDSKNHMQDIIRMETIMGFKNAR